MKKSIFWLLIFFIVLTTYSPKKNLISEPKLSIKEKIIITDNSILETIYLKNKLSYLYDENLIFLKIDKLKNKIREEKLY